MVNVLTYDIPDHEIKLKIQQFQVMGKKIQGKLITHAMNGTSVANQSRKRKSYLTGVCRIFIMINSLSLSKFYKHW